ncbi:hypothetical protein PAAG_00210 [Paracoccidioides lutzii Pb01]|uniref:Hemerythrin-like domain-containing protein n=1 Tax=Paracoccidioides lutzii (strain ATCC MYA-826 / Pb01) TaxID=502779 RepID=C1GNW5_PARBA|nr:hypothetical protein PAAG_00210 [Paracoccidioides lutzii Pb01]EEH35887.1 hypothetical protein PAAG_00210 [Paracoccidioides lutzii Pb01]
MSKPWADTPLRLISETRFKERSDIPDGHFAITCAQNMASLHNGIIRSFNSSYNQCLAIKPGTVDATDFIFYNKALYNNIRSHHDIEEDFMFPELVKLTGIQDIMDRNIQQHKDFEESLEKLREYVFQVDAKSYDGKKLQGLLHDLGPVLHKHLTEEIPTLLDLAKYDAKKLEPWWHLTSKYAQKHVDPFGNAPLMLGCIDNTFLLDGKPLIYPPVPTFVKYLSKFVLERRYAGAWRFNPCDALGNPRPLAFPNPDCTTE